MDMFGCVTLFKAQHDIKVLKKLLLHLASELHRIVAVKPYCLTATLRHIDKYKCTMVQREKQYAPST